MLSENEKTYLRQLVCQALQAAVQGQEFTPPPPPPPSAALDATGACFVTYKTAGALRGCLGCFVSQTPLWQTVATYARAAALEDPRFVGNRLSEAELPQVEFDISALSPLAPCDDPEGITLGEHGIYIKYGGASGCFLPQVATETGWSVAEFWRNCCAGKAGLPADAWRDKAVEKFTFTAEIIVGKFSV